MSRYWLLLLLCACNEHGKGGGGGGDDVAPIDGSHPSDSFVPNDSVACAMDALEPNDTIQTAFVVPSQLPSFTAVPLCPAGDKDTYAISTNKTSTLDAVATVTAGLQPASVSILNAGGTMIANGALDGPNSIRAHAANLPAGTYFVQVFGSASTTYRLDFDMQ